MSNPFLAFTPNPASATPTADFYAQPEMKLRYASAPVINDWLIEIVTNMTVSDVQPVAEVFERLFAERAEGHGEAQRDLFYSMFQPLYVSYAANIGMFATAVEDDAEAEALRRQCWTSAKLLGAWAAERGIR